METAQVFSSSQQYHWVPSLTSQHIPSAPASTSDGASAQLQQPSDEASATVSTSPASSAAPASQPQECTLNGEQLWALSVERVRAFLPELYADLMQMRAPTVVATAPPPSPPASEESAVSSAASAATPDASAAIAHAQPTSNLSGTPANQVRISVLYCMEYT